MQNDITKGACPAEAVRCVVFDEAHKALGNYSYCQVGSQLSLGGGVVGGAYGSCVLQVVKELSGRGVVFRVLALSATPGNDLKVCEPLAL